MNGVVRRAVALTGLGIIVGSGVVWMLTRVLAGLFLGVSPHDPGIFAGAPALRATRVNPARALGSS